MENKNNFECPNCSFKGLHNKLIKKSNYYICENCFCQFIDNKPIFSNLKSNINDLKNNFTENITKSNNINIMLFRICPECSNLGKIKKVVKRANLFLCEDLNCFFVEDFNELLKKIDNEIKISKEMEETVEIINLSSELLNIDEKSNNNNNLNEKLLMDPNELKITSTNTLNKTNKLENRILLAKNDPETQMNDILWKNSFKILNWTVLPCTMKSHNRILHTLLIHLDTFLIDKSPKIINIKKEYSICDAFANNIKTEHAKHIAFNFISKLFDIIDFIPKKSLANKEMDERLIMSMRMYFSVFDKLKKYTTEYIMSISCSNCNEQRTEHINDYFVPLELKKQKLNLSDNTISYNIKCVVCQNQLNKTITLKKVSQFVIIHCQKGINEKLYRFNKGFNSDNNDNESLKLVAVVECMAKFPYPDCIESELGYIDYHNMLGNSSVKQNYMVHFRNTDGWYSLNYEKPFLCSPKKTLEIESGKNIRLLIFGTLTDSSKYKRMFSFEEYRDIFKKEKKEQLLKVFSQTEDDALYRKAIEKPVIAIKTKISRKRVMKEIKTNKKAIMENIDLLDEDNQEKVLPPPRVSKSDNSELPNRNLSSTYLNTFPLALRDLTFSEIEKEQNTTKDDLSSIDYLINRYAKKIKLTV